MDRRAECQLAVETVVRPVSWAAAARSAKIPHFPRADYTKCTHAVFSLAPRGPRLLGKRLGWVKVDVRGWDILNTSERRPLWETGQVWCFSFRTFQEETAACYSRSSDKYAWTHPGLAINSSVIRAFITQTEIDIGGSDSPGFLPLKKKKADFFFCVCLTIWLC